ncbi:MAG: hypothetical protein JRJ02_14575 [Deltaproteobacteria bacterium]|nr:hypothetical protein [Deltaproteobacteria bacterium]
MTSSVKKGGNRDLDLENDLLLSSKDVEFMRKASSQNVRTLESYLDFLEDIDAFGSKKVKAEFYAAEFEL